MVRARLRSSNQMSVPLPWPPRPGGMSGARFDEAWNLAACVAVNRFLSHLKIGRPPEGLGGPTSHDHLTGATVDAAAFAQRLRSLGVTLALDEAGTAGLAGDLRWVDAATPSFAGQPVTRPVARCSGSAEPGRSTKATASGIPSP